MAMVGNTTTPGGTGGWFGFGANSQNQAASSFTMPSPGGKITNLHAYFDAWSGSANGALCLWDASGNLLASVTVGSVPAGTHDPAGQQWWTAALATPVFVAGGATIWLGFWMPDSTGFVTSTESGGASFYNSAAAPGSFASHTSSGFGALGAYADYTPSQVKVRRGGVWVTPGAVKVRRGGVWVTPTIKLRRGGAWVTIG